MPSEPLVLDTDILSILLRRQPAVVAEARTYVAEHGRFTLSCITRYEILRGLKAKGASRQIDAFDAFCLASTVLPLTDAAVTKAAEIYARLMGRGELIPDADILIAASALSFGLGVVTNNEKHFRRVEGLRVVNWT